jgi:hypothetical protein
MKFTSILFMGYSPVQTDLHLQLTQQTFTKFPAPDPGAVIHQDYMVVEVFQRPQFLDAINVNHDGTIYAGKIFQF